VNALAVLFICVFVGVLLLWAAVDFVRNQPALRRRQFLQLPSSAPTIGAREERLLRTGLVILAQAVESNQLHEASDEAARKLIKASADPIARTATLLSQVGPLMLQIESEDRLITLLSSDRHEQVSTWLNEYLNRT